MAKVNKKEIYNKPNTVLVAYNSPRGLKLTTSKGEKVIINGSPVNNILDADGNATYERYGFTRLPVDVWADLKNLYKDATFFSAVPPLLFAHEESASTIDEADEKKDVQHGFEQADECKSATKELAEE